MLELHTQIYALDIRLANPKDRVCFLSSLAPSIYQYVLSVRIDFLHLDRSTLTLFPVSPATRYCQPRYLSTYPAK
jgi:hypothetical protein